MSEHALSADARALMAFQAKKKSMLVSYLLWFFLGGVGAHRYYHGRVGSGVAMLGLSILGWATVVIGVGFAFLFAVGIWALVDACLIPGWVSRYNAALMAKLDSGMSPALVAAM
ncbi:MAG: NINE protein [Caulobacteraceae bacterium]